MLAQRLGRTRLGSRIPLGLARVPKLVQVRGTKLVWQASPPVTIQAHGKRGLWYPADVEYLSDLEGVLGRFVSLREADGEAFVEFARLYGVLGLCRHRIPWPHVQHNASGGLYTCPWLRSAEPGTEGGEEPLAAWRDLAAQATALLERMVDEPDHMSLHLDSVDRYWLKPAHVRLGLDGGRPCFLPLADPGIPFALFSVLAIQLLMVGLGAREVRKCDGCQQLFFRNQRRERRRPTRQFCTTCGPKTARAIASREYRRRQRHAPAD